LEDTKMKRWLWLMAGLVVLGLLASACTGGGDGGAPDGGEEPPAVEDVSPTPAPTAEETSPTPAPTEEPSVSSKELGVSQEAFGAVQGFLQPFGLAGGLQPLAAGDLVEGGPLEAMLLSSEDVPAGYQQLFTGSFEFDASFEDPSLGEVMAAMSMFADEGEQSGIMSMVMQAEDEAVLQEGLTEIGEADLAEFEAAFDAYSLFGIEITNVRQVNASELGDGGFGFGFTMDFSGLAAELGELYGEEAGEFTTMDMEMVMFVDGSVVGMAMTFAVDDAALASRPLAEIMAAKVAAAAV
ncbi:MAG: hypothetical protein ACE5IZ_07950, partial [Dehalococcoidia bacterium]